MSVKGNITKESKIIDYVARDKDWTGVINNERNFQENWQKDWGFLAVDYSKHYIFNKYNFNSKLMIELLLKRKEYN